MAIAKRVRRALGGQRLTAQRKLLYDLIRQGKGHLDADELYRRAKAKEPRISLSTVYRNLHLFKQLGLVEELHLDEEHHHYEGRSERGHYHLVCLGCGRVVEFQSPRIDQLKEELGQETGFRIAGVDINLSGYCSRCRQARAG